MPIHRFAIGLLALATMLAAVPALAQNYPTKTIRIVTSGPGSGNDFVARLIAPGISGPLGQQVIVDNRSGNVAIQTMVAAKSPPDGYTLFVQGSGFWLLPYLQKVPYDPVRDFSTITLAAKSPNILVVHPSLPVKSVRELIGLAKAKPGQLNFSVVGAGGSINLAAELFKSMSNTDIVSIRYKGSSEAVIGTLSGESQIMFPNAALAMPHIKSGRMKALAITTARPSPIAPDLPTVASSGLKGFESEAMFGLLAPAGTPAAIVARLNQETVKALNAADVRDKLLASGSEAIGNSPEEFLAEMKSDMAKWGKVIKDAGIVQ